jgi:hypothetical protein
MLRMPDGIQSDIHDATFEQLVQIAKKFGVKWVVPTLHAANELHVAELAWRLNIPHVSPVVTNICNEKGRLDAFAHLAGFVQPQSIICRDEKEIRSALKNLGGVVFIKPGDGFGSLNACKVDTRRPNEVDSAIEWHLEGQRRWGFSSTIVQPFVPGREFGGLAAVRNGKLKFFMTTEKQMTKGRYRKEVAHVYDPRANWRKHLESKMQRKIAALVRHLHESESRFPGMENCFFNWEIIVRPNGSMFLPDASPRIGGHLAYMADGALGAPPGYFQLAANAFAAGQADDFKPVGTAEAYLMRTAYEEGGVVVSKDGQDPRGEPQNMTGVNIFYDAFVRSGQFVPRIRTLEDAGGRPTFAVQAKTIELAEVAYSDALKSLNYTYTSGKSVHECDQTRDVYG